MSKKTAIPRNPENHLVVFQEKTIRRTWHNEEWWFAIVDAVAVLTDSVQPEGYVKGLRRRDKELAQGWGQIVTPLRIEAEGGIQRVSGRENPVWIKRCQAPLCAAFGLP